MMTPQLYVKSACASKNVAEFLIITKHSNPVYICIIIIDALDVIVYAYIEGLGN